MNCEQHSGSENSRGIAGTAAGQASLAVDMARALHDLAQPLTILRGSIGGLTMCGDFPDGSRRYIDMSVRQIERICDLLRAMQQRVEAEQSVS